MSFGHIGSLEALQVTCLSSNQLLLLCGRQFERLPAVSLADRLVTSLVIVDHLKSRETHQAININMSNDDKNRH